MFIRQYIQNENGTRRAYWAFVESYRTDAGLRQRVVAWLGKRDEAGRLGVKQAACGTQSDASAKNSDRQLSLFDPTEDDDRPFEPRWVAVNAVAVRVEYCVQFDGPWLSL